MKTQFFKNDQQPEANREVLAKMQNGQSVIGEFCGSCNGLHLNGGDIGVVANQKAIVRWAYLDSVLSDSGYPEVTSDEMTAIWADLDKSRDADKEANEPEVDLTDILSGLGLGLAAKALALSNDPSQSAGEIIQKVVVPHANRIAKSNPVDSIKFCSALVVGVGVVLLKACQDDPKLFEGVINGIIGTLQEMVEKSKATKH